jgi:quercetin dioxygenase-like cupin family protein
MPSGPLYTVLATGDVEAQHDGRYRALSEPLNVSAFKINQLELPPGGEAPEHDHTANGQEEVYAVIAGSGTLRVEGEDIAIATGSFVFCAPEARRQMIAGDEGLTWIGIGSPNPTGK